MCIGILPNFAYEISQERVSINTLTADGEVQYIFIN